MEQRLAAMCIHFERSVIQNGFFGLSSNESENQGDMPDYREKTKKNGARTLEFTT